jgi:hypothetical protein
MDETPPFGDLKGMTAWASWAADFAEPGIAGLILRGALQALSDDDRRDDVLDDFAAPDQRGSKTDDEVMADVLSEIDYVAHKLTYMWGRCALRVLGFAKGGSLTADDMPVLWWSTTERLRLGSLASDFSERFGLANVTWYLDGCGWLLSLVEAADDASETLEASACRLTPGELAGTEGSTFPAVSAEHRAEAARIIARQTLRRWPAEEALVPQVERVYLAMYAFCCRVEVLARCASEHPDDPALGALFGLLVASAISVVGELETVEAQRILLRKCLD